MWNVEVDVVFERRAGAGASVRVGALASSVTANVLGVLVDASACAM
ncbi:hypothetical protein HMPREF0724_11785 [Prescottella equi ATCC 33707]|uniref:Uncharacterized protein n=1 Tax=Prescottella equi ATCC 33707 TaxID=525370 RepID=E9T084_RHOHA|nr:hypothetical protein HMPREF0724_11785 [Prescottella equi ATCC 33707]